MIPLHHNGQQRNEHAQSHKGDLDRAIPFLERSLSLSAAANIMGYARQCRINLGHAYVLARRAGEGLDALKLAAEQGLSRTSRVHACLSVAHMALGNAEEAHRLAVSAQSVARANQERPNEAFALHVLGELAAQPGHTKAETAEGCYREAMAIASDVGMRPLVAHCHLGLGKLYCRTDKREQAQEQLTTATTMYREMDMNFWLEQAEAETRQLGEQQRARICL